MFSLRGPLCAGEAFSGSLRSRGGVVSRGETWGPGSASSQAPRLHPTYLHCVGRAKKGGHLLAGTGECGRASGQVMCMDLVSIGPCFTQCSTQHPQCSMLNLT